MAKSKISYHEKVIGQHKALIQKHERAIASEMAKRKNPKQMRLALKRQAL